MPTLCSHTHLQATQAKTQIQSLQKSMPAITHYGQNRCSKNERNLKRKMNNETLTKCKCHKGFRVMRRSEVRFNFSCNLIGNHPQSLTALTLDR